MSDIESHEVFHSKGGTPEFTSLEQEYNEQKDIECVKESYILQLEIYKYNKTLLKNKVEKKSRRMNEFCKQQNSRGIRKKMGLIATQRQ